MDEDQLDALCIDWNDSIDSQPDEVMCYKTRGMFRSHVRTVPRLPLAAMIRRMKLLEDNPDTVTRARGRAKLLSDRNKLYKPGQTQQRKVPGRQNNVTRETVRIPGKCKKKDMYNNQWQNEEFPTLGFEHTADGSPRKKHKVDDSQTTKEKEQEHVSPELPNNLEMDLPAKDDTRVTDDIIILPRKDLKPKIRNKEKDFDFKKATQSYLKEFPVPYQPPKQVLSLTQHNLEKFLRESDTESTSSSLEPLVHVKEFEDDEMPLYEKYAVTLDDISRFRYTHLQFNAKGPLGTLLNSTDTYHASPKEYFEKTDAQHLAPEDEFHNNVDNSTNSVISELSNLNSPSDNVEEMDGSVRTGFNVEHNVPASDKPKESIDKVPDNIIEKPEDVKDDIDVTIDLLKSEPEDDIACAKEESEQTEVLPSESKASPVGSSSPEGNGWRLYGEKVLQISGIPKQSDLEVLHTYVREFGTIVDYQAIHIEDTISLRYKLDSEDACDYAVQCLHDADCLYPETPCIISCHHLKA